MKPAWGGRVVHVLLNDFAREAAAQPGYDPVKVGRVLHISAQQAVDELLLLGGAESLEAGHGEP